MRSLYEDDHEARTDSEQIAREGRRYNRVSRVPTFAIDGEDEVRNVNHYQRCGGGRRIIRKKLEST